MFYNKLKPTIPRQRKFCLLCRMFLCIYVVAHLFRFRLVSQYFINNTAFIRCVIALYMPFIPTDSFVSYMVRFVRRIDITVSKFYIILPLQSKLYRYWFYKFISNLKLFIAIHVLEQVVYTYLCKYYIYSYAQCIPHHTI